MKKSYLRRVALLGVLLSLLVGCAGQAADPPVESQLPHGEPPAASASQEGQTPIPAPWTDCRIVAHAMGEVDGRAETNSKDAFLTSVEAGHRVLEIDLQLTSDGFLVARHDWDQMSYYNVEQLFADVMDHQTFLETPICFYYTPLDIDGILTLMEQYPEVYIVTDSKDTDEKTVRAQFRALSAAIDRAGDPALWERIVVQIYHEEMLEWVKEEGPVTNWIFTLYQIAEPDYAAIGSFCRENGIAVVTVEKSRVSAEMVQILHDYGCKIYLHTVNRLRAMLEMSWGADGFYSDCVTPSQLEGVLAGTNEMYLSQDENN